MGENLTRKILRQHLAKPSEMNPGDEIYLKVDQTITHDINAVMTYLAFEAIGLSRIGIESAVSYLDHNLLYIDFKTPDDHIYLQSAGVNAKEVILEMLRRETIKGGLGKVYEYFGPGALSLSVPERQTIINTSAKLFLREGSCAS